MAAGQHPGMAVIDPPGDLVLNLAAGGIPAGREQDAWLLELGDPEWPLDLSPFWAPPGVPKEVVAQVVYSVFRLLFQEQWSPTRMADAVFSLVATLCSLPGATLLDAARLLNDPLFRRRALSHVDDPATLEFWQEYEALSDAARREMARPVLYRLRALYRSPAVRNLLCQSRGLDFLELMDQGAILLVSLAGQAIQAEADLLGELLISQIHLAALARLSQRREDRRPFYLLADESQRFQGASAPILLREGRKLGVTLILLSQYLEAWSAELSEAILGNVGTLVVFRCSPNDSHRLGAALKPFTPEDLEDLARFEAVAKLQVAGETMPAFDFRLPGLQAIAPRDEAALARIRARTRQRFARPRREVEEEIHPAQRPRDEGWEGMDVDEE